MLLGLGDELLPVVPDEHATPAEFSKVKAFGKIPSEYTYDGKAYGIAKWQSKEITPAEIARWSADRRYSMCVRTSAIRAIDVDLSDAELGKAADSLIAGKLGIMLPRRTRPNSCKFLLAFRLEGEHKKRIIDTGRKDEKGKPQRIEFLANGQQFVAAGSHPSGAPYEWDFGLPDDFPTLTLDQFEELWQALSAQFGVIPNPSTLKPEGGSHDPADQSPHLTTIDGASLADLNEALSFLAPTIEDNDGWSEVGYALLSLGPQGRDLYIHLTPEKQWQAAREDWWLIHESQTPRSDYRHIFTLARAKGWREIERTTEPEKFPEPVPSIYGAIGEPDLLEPATPEKPVIRLTAGHLHLYATQAEKILSPNLYTLGNLLAHIGAPTELSDGVKRDLNQQIVIQATMEWLRRELTRLATIQKFSKLEDAWVDVDCPKDFATNITDQKVWPHLRPLTAIVRAPFMRSDGTFCDTRGYDARTAVFYSPNADFPDPVPEPTRDDALAALNMLLEPFDEFPFATAASRSAFLAHILTEASRTAYNTAPMFWYTAPSAGTGKTLLSAMPSMIVHGVEASQRPWIDDADEMRKTLFASLLAGDRSITFDNVPSGAKVRSAELCRFLTTTDTYKDRRLGKSEVIGLPNRSVVSASGNNVTPVGDMSRRSLVVRLDANTAALKARTFIISDLREHVSKRRPELLVAALTILVAYYAHRQPTKNPLPSYESWSRFVRDALLWLDQADPIETQEEETDDENLAVEEAFKLIAAAMGGKDFTARELTDMTQQIADYEGKLGSALSASGCSDTTNSTKVGYWLRDKRDMIAGDHKLERGTISNGYQKWRLRCLTVANEDLI